MLKQMFNQLREVAKYGMMHVRNEKGQGMVEYALIIGLVAVLLVGALVLLSGGVQGLFENITDILGSPETQEPSGS